jgi:hypothetical protein
VTLTERERLLSALYSLIFVNWNKSKAAEQLHWSRMTLYRKMAKYHIRESKVGQPRGRDPQAKTVTSVGSLQCVCGTCRVHATEISVSE